jgi:hypothetical protein
VGGSGSQNYTQSAFTTTYMKPLPPCKFEVRKIPYTSNSSNVQFGTQLSYEVIFHNAGGDTTVGTVMDAVRLTDQAYGTPVPYTGTWSCKPTTIPAVTPSVSSAGVPVLGLAGPNPVSGNAIFTPLPTQGSPIFHLTNIFFPANSKLTCVITITVYQPSKNNPNCSATPTYLDNLALMDVTNPYNPNEKWPPSYSYTMGGLSPLSRPPTNWATADAQLPQCYDVIVNKSATPAWTSTNGPAVNYTITVTNTGTGSTPLPGSMGGNSVWNGLLLTDNVSSPYAGYPVFLTSPPYCPGATWCDPITPTGSSGAPSPSYAGVADLPPQTSENWDLTLNTMPPNPLFLVGQTIPNCVNVAPSGTFTGPGWYANYANPQPPPNPPVPPQQACASVPVLATAIVDVIKTIVNNTGGTIAVQPTTPFGGGMTCGGYPLLPVLTPGDGAWTQTDPSGLTTLLNGQSVSSTTAAVIQNVPVAATETCTAG